MNTNISSFVFKLVALTFSHLNLSQKKNLSDLIVAFFHNKSFALWEIAGGLSGETSHKHKHKRLIYFLDTLTIDINFWKSFALTIFSLPGMEFRRRKTFTLSFDATTLKEDFWLLVVSLNYQGRAIPLLVKGWEHVNQSYNYWDRVRETLSDLKAILPKGYTFEIVADRGFSGESMFNICDELDIDFIVRINDSYKVKLANGKEFIQLSLFDDGYYKLEYLGQKNKRENMHLAVGTETRDGQSSTWYLVSNNAQSAKEIVNKYATRFWIEEGFKDLKSRLHWEKYTEKIPTKDRLLKSVVVSSLSYAIQTALGNALHMSKSERERTSLFNKFQQTFKRTTKELEYLIMKFNSIVTKCFNRAKFAFS